jgi:hypothetical protein
MFEVVLDGTDAIGASAATAAPGGDAFEERAALLRRQSAGGRHDDPQSERRSTRTCRAVASQGVNKIVAHRAIKRQCRESVLTKSQMRQCEREIVARHVRVENVGLFGVRPVIRSGTGMGSAGLPWAGC